MKYDNVCLVRKEIVFTRNINNNHTCYLISRVMCGVSKWAISGVSYVDIPYLDPDLSK